jgi:nicotinate-nucleotide--dimethylbenzimidazole phosphoribosyltransferase
VLDAGVDFGAGHPTIAAVAAIVAGEAALARAARAAQATIVVVDAGVAEPGALPPSVIGVARGRGGDLSEGAALTPLEAIAAMEAGVALVTALVEDGLDVLAVGAIGAGGDLAAAAVIAGLIAADADAGRGDADAGRGDADAGRGDADTGLAPIDGRALVASGLATLPRRATPLDVLGAVGGRDVAVLAGAVLAAAAMHVPIVLDGAVTMAATLTAARLAPAVTGYLLCAHGGGGAAAAAARATMGLVPLLSAGLGQGEGTGAAMMLPVIAGACEAGAG